MDLRIHSRPRATTRLRPWAAFAALAVIACSDDDDDRAPRDAAASSDQRDASPPRDAGRADAAPLAGCSRDQDCALPDGVNLCTTCTADDTGPQTCLGPRCRDNACALELTSTCPEITRVFGQCASDLDCTPDKFMCLHTCRDGQSACLAGTCQEGRCFPRFDACGLERCPPGTTPVRAACGGCGLSGGCSGFVTGCFPSCDDQDDCAGSTPTCDARLGACVPAWGCL